MAQATVKDPTESLVFPLPGSSLCSVEESVSVLRMALRPLQMFLRSVPIRSIFF